MYTLLLVLLVLDAVILTIAILLQAGQGGGLASLGGGAGTEMFVGGRQAATILTKMTWWCSGIFLSIALMLEIMQSHASTAPSVLQQQQTQQAPAQQAAPLPLQTTPPTPSQTPPNNR